MRPSSPLCILVLSASLLKQLRMRVDPQTFQLHLLIFEFIMRVVG